MDKQQNGSIRFIAILLGAFVFALAGFTHADPPARVARVGFVSGPVSFSPAGEDDWVEATLNRPLVTGDRLWANTGARVELQVGTAAIRLGASTGITLLNLDDRVAQLQLAQGTLSLRVRRLDPDQVVEIDTPNLAYVVRRPGQYRISVDPDGNATEVRTRNGQAEVYGEGASYVVDAGKSYRFSGTGLRDFEDLALPAVDAFDRWAQERDRGYDYSPSARYVSRDVIGYQDLDAGGTWRSVPEYGNVWIPTRVSAGWAPYRDGRWAWVEPWGWTWIDNAPWGFAVSHYGRWANIDGSWGWIPGPVATRAVYAPALVAFIGGSNFEVAIASGNVGAVGWFPLGPRDVYRPAYQVSRTYFTNVNVSNAVISNTQVINVYNNPQVTNVTYVNQHVAGAVVTVPTSAFVQSQPVARHAMRVPLDTVVRAPVTNVAAIAPIEASVRGAAPQGTKPPPQVLERRAVAKNVPPPAPVGFAARERMMAVSPGKPVDPSALAAARPATPVPPANVQVVAPAAATHPPAAPPKQQVAQPNPRGKNEPTTQPQANAPAPKPAPGQPRNKLADEPTTQQQANAPAPKPAPGQPRNMLADEPTTQQQANAPAPKPAPGQPRGKVADEPTTQQQANAPAPKPAPGQPRNKLADEPTTQPQANAPAPMPSPRQPRGKVADEPTTQPQANAPTPMPSPRQPRGKVADEPTTQPQANAPAPMPAPREPRNKVEARNQPAAPPAPVAVSPTVAQTPPAIAPAPAPSQPPPEPRNKAEARNQPNVPSPIATAPATRASPEQQRGRPEPPAAVKPTPTAPPAAAPAPAVPREAGGPPPSAPSPKVAQRGKEPRPAGEKKGDEPGKGDDEPKRK